VAAPGNTAQFRHVQESLARDHGKTMRFCRGFTSLFFDQRSSLILQSAIAQPQIGAPPSRGLLLSIVIEASGMRPPRHAFERSSARLEPSTGRHRTNWDFIDQPCAQKTAIRGAAACDVRTWMPSSRLKDVERKRKI